MRLVKWQDTEGYKHLSWVKDNDPDSEAPTGIPADPPDLSQVDWAGVQKELHNLFIERGLTDWEALQAQNGGLSSAILGVIKKRIIYLYRQGEVDNGR